MASSHGKALAKKLPVQDKNYEGDNARFQHSRTVKNGVATFGGKKAAIQDKKPIPGYRKMSASSRRNARMEHIFATANERARSKGHDSAWSKDKHDY